MPLAQRRLAARLARVATLLERAYGRPRRRLEDPLDSLIGTVLSQNTSDLNSERAFGSLKAAFPSWPALARAQPRRVERVIHNGGLARTKSRRILQLLRLIRRREGGYDLRRWRRLTRAAAAARLELPGVGPKTRACVQLFALGQPAFPVDTHVHRIALRLGLAPALATAPQTQERLTRVLPDAGSLGLHLNLIRLGRVVCRPRQPRCTVCPLRRACRHARAA